MATTMTTHPTSRRTGALDTSPANHAGLTRRWWALALRGLAAVVFGVLTFINPGASLVALITLFGAYALVDGVFNVVAAGRGAAAGQPWGALLLEGLASIAAGVLTFAWPGVTALVLLMLIAAWAVVKGVAELAAALRLRKSIQGEWLLALTGILSVAFGVFLFLRPGAGALAMVVWIGAYAIVFGALLLGLAFRLRSLGRALERRAPPPAGHVPTPA